MGFPSHMALCHPESAGLRELWKGPLKAELRYFSPEYIVHIIERSLNGTVTPTGSTFGPGAKSWKQKWLYSSLSPVSH